VADMRIGRVAALMGLSVSGVRALADKGALPSHRTAGGHRVFDPGEIAIALAGRKATLDRLGVPALEHSYALSGLAEHEVWREVVGDLNVERSSSAAHVMEYAFKEMLNNAIEHSDGHAARVLFWVTGDVLAFVVSDDGVGALERLRAEHGLKDTLSSVQELTKGKRTTDPVHHSGQGIFFTSKAVDRFTLTANGWVWVVDNVLGDQTVAAAGVLPGTTVTCEIDRHSERTMTDVFAPYGTEFDRTRPAVKLGAYGTNLMSRSEARRLVQGLDEFTEVDLDFEGVDSVGQGFVDEVFRVWAVDHPRTRIVPVNMAPAVRFMVERGLPGPSPR
jgi:DNA-binding transcriptional MerR regulator